MKWQGQPSLWEYCRVMIALISRVFFFCLVGGLLAFSAWAEDWRQLAPGLELREFLVPDAAGDLGGAQGGMAVLRIDPARCDVALGAALYSGRPLSMQEWARQFDFAAVINAGMFRSDDRLRSTGLMRDTQMEVSSFIHPDYGAFLAFHPRDKSLPALRWVDRKLDADWRDVLAQYDGVIQNYRLISRARENLWTPTDRRHSVAAIAMDRAGSLLFIHCRPPLSMYEFAQALLDLPLDLVGAMYVEGGADAGLYVHVEGFQGRWVGEYQSGYLLQGSNRNFWPTPNVLGVRLRQAQ